MPTAYYCLELSGKNNKNACCNSSLPEAMFMSLITRGEQETDGQWEKVPNKIILNDERHALNHR